MPQPEVLNAKVQTSLDPPRFASLSTARLLATTVYVVALVDRTGRLVDPATLKATPDPNRAIRLHASLVQKQGGKVILPLSSPPEPRKQKPAPPERPAPSAQKEPVYQPQLDRWLMKFSHNGQAYREHFPTEAEAIVFRNRIKNEGA